MANEFKIKNGFISTGKSIISGSFINNVSGYVVLDTSQLTLSDTFASQSIDWKNRFLVSSGGNRVVRWDTQTLNDTSNFSSVDWKNRALNDASAIKAITWGNRSLTRSSTNTSLDWENLRTYDAATSESMHWGKRWLVDTSGSTILDWQTGTLNGTASYAVTASYVLGGGGTPGGLNSYIQFNTSGAFDGASDLVYNKNRRGLENGYFLSTKNGLYGHAEGAFTETRADYSHAEGMSTYTGIANGVVGTITAGLITIDTSYGDVTTNFVPGYTVVIDDSLYDYSYGYNVVGTITGSSWDGTNTTVQLVDNTITTTTAIFNSIDYPASGVEYFGGLAAHTEGTSATAIGTFSHVEGEANSAFGVASHAEGISSTTIGNYSHAEGGSNYTYGYASHAEGSGNYTLAAYSHAEGNGNYAGYLGYSNDGNPITAGVFNLDAAHGDLTSTFAPGTIAIIDDGTGNISGIGVKTTYLFEVSSSTWTGTNTEITLVDTTVDTSTETKYTIGIYGNQQPPATSTYIGDASHAAGNLTQTIGRFSSTAGNDTRAVGWYQTVIGQYNQPLFDAAAFIIGDGIDDSNRHNLFVATSGSVTISGSLNVVGTTTGITNAATASYVNGMVSKNNVIANTSFAGTPLTASVSFSTAFPDTNYSVVITGEDARVWTVESKTSSGFVVNSNSSTALAGNTFWQAVSYGEFNN